MTWCGGGRGAPGKEMDSVSPPSLMFMACMHPGRLLLDMMGPPARLLSHAEPQHPSF